MVNMKFILRWMLSRCFTRHSKCKINCLQAYVKTNSRNCSFKLNLQRSAHWLISWHKFLYTLWYFSIWHFESYTLSLFVNIRPAYLQSIICSRQVLLRVSSCFVYTDMFASYQYLLISLCVWDYETVLIFVLHMNNIYSGGMTSQQHHTLSMSHIDPFWVLE